MHKTFSKFISLILLLLNIFLLSSCDKTEVRNQNNTTPKFAIYFVKEEEKKNVLSYGRDENTGEYIKPSSKITEVSLEDLPVVTERDIEKYYWSSHEIQFKDEYLKKHMQNKNIEYTGKSNLLGGECHDVVIIVVNGNRIYSAGFSPLEHHSHFPPEVMFSDTSKNAIGVINNGNDTNDKLIGDKRIYKVLKELTLLEE